MEESPKNLDELINIQMSARDNTGKTNEANTQKPKTVYESVLIEYKELLSELNTEDEEIRHKSQTDSPEKTKETQTVKPRVDKNWASRDHYYEDFNEALWAFCEVIQKEVKITGLENQLNYNVKIIRCDNGTEFKNHAMNEFCAKKGIKREFSVARTPQQNGIAERKNKTLIEAARAMLADLLLPIPFWAEAVNTACYVLNRVLVTKPQNKTPYELLIGLSGKDKGPTQEYILLPLQPHRTKIPVKDVAPAAHDKPSESSPKDNNAQDSEDACLKGSTTSEEIEKEKRGVIAISQKKAAQATITTKHSTNRPAVSTDMPYELVQGSWRESKEERKPAKAEPTVHKDPVFDDLDDDAIDYIETEDDQDEGRTSSVVLEEKESADKEVSTEAPVRKVLPRHTKQLNTYSLQYLVMNETIAQVLITMSQNKQKEKEKGVEIRNVEDTERPRPTSTRSMLTLKPLSKIDPKDKGKKNIDEDSFKKNGIKEEKKRQEFLLRSFKWKKREKFNHLTKKKFLHDTITYSKEISAQHKILTSAKNEVFRLTLLRDTTCFYSVKRSNKWYQRQDQNFVAIGSAKDERQIKELNKDPKKKRVIKETPRKEDTGKTNEAEEALRRIKRKLSKLQTLAIPKEGEDLMICLRQRNETISSVLLVEREGNPDTFYPNESEPRLGMKISTAPTEKKVQALIHMERSLRTVFRKYKVKVVTDGPMEETLKLAARERRLGKWATEIRTYDISYVQRKEAE
ncbi:putative ribonuclease H-like domain-containing protein [Tanacetum coccineum]|uniref:Ribonuclease H-like domain-containing protein n=1 Tax=Tanacetum coccineum TaxID=301880 RepID=A0ABQ5HZH5_9ASTR